MSNAAFVLMNCDLVAVPLQLGATGVVTVYCGAKRANELLAAPERPSDIGQAFNPSRAAEAPALRVQAT